MWINTHSFTYCCWYHSSWGIDFKLDKEAREFPQSEIFTIQIQMVSQTKMEGDNVWKCGCLCMTHVSAPPWVKHLNDELTLWWFTYMESCCENCSCAFSHVGGAGHDIWRWWSYQSNSEHSSRSHGLGLRSRSHSNFSGPAVSQGTLVSDLLRKIN